MDHLLSQSASTGMRFPAAELSTCRVLRGSEVHRCVVRFTVFGDSAGFGIAQALFLFFFLIC